MLLQCIISYLTKLFLVEFRITIGIIINVISQLILYDIALQSIWPTEGKSMGECVARDGKVRAENSRRNITITYYLPLPKDVNTKI